MSTITRHIVNAKIRITLTLAIAAFVLLGVPQAIGAPPSNDNFADATVITSLPFDSGPVGISEATTEPGEPLWWFGQSRTVWWSFTPAIDATYTVTVGGDWSAFLSIYRAESCCGFDGLTRLTWGGPESYTFALEAGTTYYIQSGDDYPYGWTNTVSLTIREILPPANDNFVDAIAFTSAPFSDSPDLTAATVEPGEPIACGSSFTQSAWYAFTPTASGSYGGFGITGINVYTGTTLEGLTSIACSDWPGLYFWATAGTTYYLQYFGGGMKVDVVPPPAADFTYSPGDPSVFDEVSFSYWIGGYWDPTVTGYSWDFGDETTASGSPVLHKFAKDGDYTVTITVYARGGRTNTATKIVQVRTPDTTPPVITAPASVIADATTPSGATVSYTVTATDDVDGPVPVSCVPPSGSLFAIGDTPVECSAEDAAGNVAEASFTVHVKGASEQIVDLMADVSALSPPATAQLKSGLNFMLNRALQALSVNDGQTACVSLGTYIRYVQQLMLPPAPKLALAEGQHMLTDARRIRVVVGC